MEAQANRRTARGAWLLGASALLPMAATALRVPAHADAAHDADVVRALGFGWAGAFRALDVVPAWLFLALPIGTRALRAGLAGAALAGVAGALLYELSARLLDGESRARTPRLVALLASLSVTLCGAWAVESRACGTQVLGAVLALAPIAFAPHAARSPRGLLWLAAGLCAAISYELDAGAVALAGTLPQLFFEARPTRWPRRAHHALAAATGLLPLGAALLWAPLASKRLTRALFEAPLGPASGAAAGLAPLELAFKELGPVLLALALAGAGIVGASSRLRARGAAVPLAALLSAGLVSLGTAAGPSRYGAPALLLLGLLGVCASVAMHAAVARVAEAKLPLAGASAAMVLVLESTFPVLALDDALARTEPEAEGAPRGWDDVAFESLPPDTLLVTESHGIYAHALASRAAGELRGDLSVLPLYDLDGEDALGELSRSPELLPFWRDTALVGELQERTLSNLAAARSIAFDLAPRQGPDLARHTVPAGLFALFAPEPRGASERKAAMGPSSSVGALADAGLGARDPMLAVLTSAVLAARARSAALLGEKESAQLAQDEALSFATAGSGGRRGRRLAASRLTWSLVFSRHQTARGPAGKTDGS